MAWNTRQTGRRKRFGGSIVEMALTLTILTNLTFGMVEFGYYFYVQNAFSNAAREGCRAGLIPAGYNTNVSTAVSNALTGYKFPANSYSVSVTDTSGNSIEAGTTAANTPIQVTVSATWSVIGAGFRPLNLIGGSKVVKGVCTVNKE